MKIRSGPVQPVVFKTAEQAEQITGGPAEPVYLVTDMTGAHLEGGPSEVVVEAPDGMRVRGGPATPVKSVTVSSRRVVGGPARFVRTVGAGSLYNPGAIFGVSWDKGSSPTLTRTGNSVGMVAAAGVDATPVVNDFDNAYPYSEMTEVTDDYGNVFIRIPAFYIRKTDAVGLKKWEICRSPLPGSYLPKCFGSDGYAYIGKYNGNLDSGGTRLESKSGRYPLIKKTIADFRSYARANGPGYQQLDIHALDLLQTLFIVEFATLNSQAIMDGFVSGRFNPADAATATEVGANRIVVSNATASNYVVGQSIGIGSTFGGDQIFANRTITSITVVDVSNMALNFDGSPVTVTLGNKVYSSGWRSGACNGIAATSGSIVSNSDSKHPLIYRGVENLWGNVWSFVDGVNFNSRQAWVCPNADNYQSGLFSSPYESISYVDGLSSGFAVNTGFDSLHPYACFPITVGGSDATYYSDYYNQAAGSTILVGLGSWQGLQYVGLFVVYASYATTYLAGDIGGRLQYKAP